MRAVGATALTVLVLFVAACGGEEESKSTPDESVPAGRKAAAPRPADASGGIDVVDFGFKPTNATVQAGTSVKWTNTGERAHTVKQVPSSREAFSSRAIEPRGVHRHTFVKRGRFRYFCTLHPKMRGIVTAR